MRALWASIFRMGCLCQGVLILVRERLSPRETSAWSPLSPLRYKVWWGQLLMCDASA
jgi:hypothetical protein